MENNIEFDEVKIKEYLNLYNIDFDTVIPFLKLFDTKSYYNNGKVFHYFRLHFLDLNANQIHALLYLYYNSYSFRKNDNKSIHTMPSGQESNSTSNKRPRIKR